MELESFVALLAERPSAAPVPVDWDAVESWLGQRLPGDYKALASAYGPLDVGEFIWVHTPCSQNRETGREYDYGQWLRETHRYVLLNSRESAQPEPPPLHPEPQGLLAWGETRGGSYLLWDTGASTDPDAWPTMVFDLDEASNGRDPWLRLDMPMLEFLRRAIRGELPTTGRRRPGPLPAQARRTAYLPQAEPWVPPPPRPEVPPERRAALTDGSGLSACPGTLKMSMSASFVVRMPVT